MQRLRVPLLEREARGRRSSDYPAQSLPAVRHDDISRARERSTHEWCLVVEARLPRPLWLKRNGTRRNWHTSARYQSDLNLPSTDAEPCCSSSKARTAWNASDERRIATSCWCNLNGDVLKTSSAGGCRQLNKRSGAIVTIYWKGTFCRRIVDMVRVKWSAMMSQTSREDAGTEFPFGNQTDYDFPLTRDDTFFSQRA